MIDEAEEGSDPSTEAKLAEARAILEAVEAALDGQPVSEFMESFNIVLKAKVLREEADTRSGVVADSEEIDTPYGKYTQVTVSSDGTNEGVGTSRYPKKALSYALEDLAEKVLK